MPKIQMDTRDHKVGQDTSVILDDQGVIERPDLDIQPIEGPNAESLASELAFMEEPIEVIVAESTDERAENPIFTAVNGVTQFFWRGQPQTVKRKYIEVLARAKQTDVRTNVMQQHAGAEPINRIDKTTALKYPFQIISDPSGRKGSDWLKRILAQG